MTKPYYAELYNDPSKINWGLPVVIDFESYYSKEWSLSKVTTEKYIRDDQWECIGVSIKVGSEPTKFFRGETGIPIIAGLVKELPNSPFISHNNTFDMGILGMRYKIHPNFYVDTAIMAKLCGLDRVAGGTSLAKLSDYMVKMGVFNHVKGTTVQNMLGVRMADMSEQQWAAYSDYCILDTNLCYELYRYMLDKVPTEELIMADITTKMWTMPVISLDVPLLQDYALKLEQDKQDKLQSIAKDMGFSDTAELHKHLRSSKKFVPLLERLGVDVPMKWSEKKQDMIPAVSKTDLEFLELLNHENELVRALVETKLGTMSSMEQTRTATFLDIATRGLLPIPLRYASAHTGRYGGCFVADTKVLCLTNDQCITEKNIVDVLLSDLVWDGEEWCEHSGVEFNGYQEVITHDGLTGTHNHRVFIDETTETTLFEAMRTGTPIMDCKLPPNWAGETAKVKSSTNQETNILAPVYDITNCGSRHRYMANRKLVHNSDKINLQNLSKRTKEPILRRSMTAGRGNVLLATDSSSIEARLLAFVADQKDLVDTFVNGRDVYIEMATKIYNKSYDEVFEVSKRNPTKEGKAMRNMGKACILGCGYSMSGTKFALTSRQQGIDITDDYAKELVAIYRASYSKIPAFWGECDRVLDVMFAGGSMWFGGDKHNLFYADGSSAFHGLKIPSIRLPNGTYIFYQNLRQEIKDNGRVGYVYDQFKGRSWLPKSIFGGSLTENLVQALAFVLLKYQAIEIAKAGIPVNMNVHDEWVSIVPRTIAAKAAVIHHTAMKSTPEYIPDGLLDCEVDVGSNYADLKHINMEKFI